MMRSFRQSLSDSRGASAIEFALAAPVVVLFLVGLAQLGILFMANAGLRNAVAEGARLATLYPLPSDQQLSQRMRDARFGLQDANMSQPTIVHGTINGANYVDITIQYTVPLNFAFFRPAPVTLVQTRRAFVTPAA